MLSSYRPRRRRLYRLPSVQRYYFLSADSYSFAASARPLNERHRRSEPAIYPLAVAAKLFGSPSTGLRACTEFIEVTNGGNLILLMIFRSAELDEGCASRS